MTDSEVDRENKRWSDSIESNRKMLFFANQ